MRHGFPHPVRYLRGGGADMYRPNLQILRPAAISLSRTVQLCSKGKKTRVYCQYVHKVTLRGAVGPIYINHNLNYLVQLELMMVSFTGIWTFYTKMAPKIITVDNAQAVPSKVCNKIKLIS